ncbi:MAG: SprT family zinc-dependent metalloprotease, partial [Chloroflexota bacterium]|nr:SprT family zinc-dependent metalloprotease [Chloroflexota bacterium]
MHQITISDLVVDVVRKDIRNMHLAVYPPGGRVRVAAPLLVDDEAVRLAVISKLAWIKRHRAEFQGQERQSAREYIYRESHYYWGDRYLLNVVYHDAPPQVIVRNKTTLDLYVRPGSDTLQRERVMLAWYRHQIKAAIPPLIAKWEPIVGVDVADWGVKRMKTKWGSCTIEAGRIWLNLELVKKPPRCLEYIVVHEIVHLLERLHNERFVAYMDEFMPQWRLLRDELNQAP